jgi:pimeloyl-ACP methyl ester carboxylesterase
MFQIESLLSARLFLQPQKVGNRIFFESNLSGHISLYAMNYGGSVPEPLLPPDIALHNPHLLTGKTFFVYPKLGKIIVMIDKDGDENYQPMAIPIEGGYPQPTFDNFFAGYRVHIDRPVMDRNLLYLVAESRQEPRIFTYQGNLDTGELIFLGESPFGFFPEGANHDQSLIALREEYTLGDNVLYIGSTKRNQPELLYGAPMEKRAENLSVPLNYISSASFIPDDRGLLFVTALFEDTRGLGYLALDNREQVLQVKLEGVLHHGAGELEELEPLKEDRYLVKFNIEGCSWLYEGRFDINRLVMSLEHVVCGEGPISNGVLEHVYYDEDDDCFSLAFSTATSPTQIYTVEGKDRKTVVRHTNERILAIPSDYLSPGEDASFTSFDGTRVSSRLYLPSTLLGYEGPRPVVYYVHGGPQGQERPDFAWFSMPLIQFLTLNGFAVFVPNVRGSTGYGLGYAKQVDRDWGGKDRLDHVHALTHFLPNDKRLDVSRAGVVGRSYGGYMTLTLAGRHPELWAAAVDMFGPYDLLTFSNRIPETWKPYFKLSIGDPEDEDDRKQLVERSPRTYLDNLACPMLVIQGKNDPRVVERESNDLVTDLRGKGKDIEYLMFENEGHDVLKFENRVICYNAITNFFKKYLKP